jgi:hypothetical protein
LIAFSLIAVIFLSGLYFAPFSSGESQRSFQPLAITTTGYGNESAVIPYLIPLTLGVICFFEAFDVPDQGTIVLQGSDIEDNDSAEALFRVGRLLKYWKSTIFFTLAGLMFFATAVLSTDVSACNIGLCWATTTTNDPLLNGLGYGFVMLYGVFIITCGTLGLISALGTWRSTIHAEETRMNRPSSVDPARSPIQEE